MIIEHKIVIADVKLVANFQRSVLSWRKRFTEQLITDFCSVIRINSTAPFEEQENYFLLCDVLPEDRVLREELQKQRLKEILEQQWQERNDTNFYGICMFCNEEFLGNRSVLLNHMASEYKKLDNLQCLYYKKTFKDKNSEYDRFYVINYLELEKSWEEVQLEDDRKLLYYQEDDWSDWEEHPDSAVCLFCEKQAETIEKLYVHMEDAHKFDLLKIKSELGLNFYQQVKLVSFIWRQVHQCRSYGCHVKFKSKADLRTHMVSRLLSCLTVSSKELFARKMCHSSGTTSRIKI
uniref:ZN622/Rei1/Reh1 zinc finger C2H2-type domain-containing protein n=1 Tax=Saimiri boliviensis boliviensis TaxID=39432 RepID=A0A2K6UVG3_SAIBB